MRVAQTEFEEVLILEPDAFADKRGFLMETYQQERYMGFGIHSVFVQDNLSRSLRGTLRGLHYQHPHPQAKLVQVLQGAIFDVVVDIRKGSPRFGRWAGALLSEENKHQLYVPKGFAHGFCALSEAALVYYKCSDLYAPDSEGGILWSDPDLSISWPVKDPLISDKDSRYPFLRDTASERLPTYERNP